MTPPADFDDEFRRLIRRSADSLPESQGFSDRMISAARQGGAPATVAHRPWRDGRRRWLPPLLAAAAVAMVATGAAIAIAMTHNTAAPSAPHRLGTSAEHPTTSAASHAPGPSSATPTATTPPSTTTTPTASTSTPSTGTPDPTRPSPHRTRLAPPPPNDTHPSAPASSTSRAATKLSPCTTANLTLRLSSHVGAGGRTYNTYDFTNTGTTPCTLFGYPGLAGLDAAGHIVQHPARRTTDLPGYNGGPKQVTLKPGHRAQFGASTVDATPNPDCPIYGYKSATLQVYPPNQTTPILLPKPGAICDLMVGYVRPT